MKVVNFLDVTLDLDKQKFTPYNKPNNTPTYIHCHSNHPPNITSRIPDIVNKRLNKLSQNEEDFNLTKIDYQNALNKSGYEPKLKFEETLEETNKKTKRTRKITWFNPPYAANLKTNIGKKFLQLVKKHFGKNSPLHKTLNTSTVKLSYSCTPNIKTIIQQHNKRLLNTKNTPTRNAGCNCRKQPCPLNGHCLTECVVYEA